jgi:3-phenylpropionate/trans-cinnamate dioxygenase ferredoxin reductase subunit
MERVVVVGAGQAGGRACEELRHQGYQGSIVLVGEESHRPYDRPPLSKGVLTGKLDDTTFPIDLDGVEVLLGRRATGLRPGVLETDAGPLDFDGLVIATGVSPVTLPGDGRQRVLRTIEDALELREKLTHGARVAIVGAGWIGAEVATAAVAAGARVVVVERGDAPLVAALDVAVGRETVRWYAELGIELRLGTAVAAIRPDGLDLAGGEHLPADVVVVGIGVRPRVDWLEGSGVALDRGVVTDEFLAVSWAAGGGSVVAAGDCAAWWSARFGSRLRVEHWDNAQHAPAAAVANLLGRPTRYDPVPYVWSDQFGRMLQFAGHRPPGAAPVWRGDPSDQKWTVGWFDAQSRLSAIFTVARPLDVVAGRRLIAARTPADQDRFADLSVPVKSL